MWPGYPLSFLRDLELTAYQDITPAIVQGVLPVESLPHDHPQPIHILLDRFDGRTKDYMVSFHLCYRVNPNKSHSILRLFPQRRLDRSSNLGRTRSCRVEPSPGDVSGLSISRWSPMPN